MLKANCCCSDVMLSVEAPDVECEDGSMESPLSASFVITPGQPPYLHTAVLFCCPVSQ